MRSILIFSFLFLQFFCACNSNDQQAASGPENDVDAARMFIQAALDGNFSKAKQLMVQDSLNSEYLNAAERNYENHMSREDKRGYREASINVHNIRQAGNDTTVVNYSNSYKKQSDSLRVVKINGQWLVDLKYSFQNTGSGK